MLARRAQARRLAAVTAALLGLGLTVAPASRADPLDVGVQDETMITAGQGLGWGFHAAQDLGARWVRVNLFHSRVLANPYDFSHYDAIVDWARVFGLNVQLTISGEYESLTPAAYARFVTAVVEHFRGRVTRYSLYNEPNCCGFLRPHAGCGSTPGQPTWRLVRVRRTKIIRRIAIVRVLVRRGRAGHRRWVIVRRRRVVRQRTPFIEVTRRQVAPRPTSPDTCSALGLITAYRQLYRAGYRAAKAVDPSAEVLLGELAPMNAIDWLRGLLCLRADGSRLSERCGRTYADGVAVHPYQFDAPPSGPPPAGWLGIGDLASLARVLADAKRAGTLTTPTGHLVGMYLTEFGYMNGAKGDVAKHNQPDGVRARWLRQALTLACRTRGVRQLVYYELFPVPSSNWNTSIIDRDGSPKAPYRALRDWIASNPACVTH